VPFNGWFCVLAFAKFSFVFAKNWVKLKLLFLLVCFGRLGVLMLLFAFSFLSNPSQRRVSRNKSLKHRHFVAGQFLSRAFVVLLRKSIPQNHNLKTAA